MYYGTADGVGNVGGLVGGAEQGRWGAVGNGNGEGLVHGVDAVCYAYGYGVWADVLAGWGAGEGPGGAGYFSDSMVVNIRQIDVAIIIAPNSVRAVQLSQLCW